MFLFCFLQLKQAITYQNNLMTNALPRHTLHKVILNCYFLNFALVSNLMLHFGDYNKSL